MKAAQKSAGSLAALKAWDTIRARRNQPKPKPKPKPKLVPQTPIKMPKQAGTISTAEMMARTVVLVLTINSIGNRRKVNPNTINITDAKTKTTVDREWIGVTKKLYDAEELDEITSQNGKTRQYVESRALPSTIKKGVYLLPVDFIEEVNIHLTEDAKKLKPLVEKMIGRLDEYTSEAKNRLGHQFDATQYPTQDELRAAFRLTWRYVYVDSAKNLEAVSKEIYEEERKKAEASWAETRETIQQLLRAQFAEKVNHFIDRLTPGEDGKAKIFREGSVDKFQEFLTTFDPRNITNDVKMKVLVDKAKSLINTADTDMLRTDESVRDYVRHGFETIKVLLDPMVVNKPHRAITLED